MMDVPEIVPEKREYNGRFRFIMMVSASIVIACLLVFLSLKLYDWSGASQLDFSLPSYNGLRKDIKTDDDVNFPSTGAIDQSTIDQFNQQFSAQLKQAKESNGFSTKALDDGSLGINMPDGQ